MRKNRHNKIKVWQVMSVKHSLAIVSVCSSQNNTPVHELETVYTRKSNPGNAAQTVYERQRLLTVSWERGREGREETKGGERRGHILSRGRRFSGGLGQKSSVWLPSSPWELCSSHASPTTLPLPSLHCCPNIFTEPSVDWYERPLLFAYKWNYSAMSSSCGCSIQLLKHNC